MKKLLILLLIVPIISFGQTAKEYIKSGNQKDDTKDYNGAISDYTKAIELNPDAAVAYYNRGNSKII